MYSIKHLITVLYLFKKAVDDSFMLQKSYTLRTLDSVLGFVYKEAKRKDTECKTLLESLSRQIQILL